MLEGQQMNHQIFRTIYMIYDIFIKLLFSQEKIQIFQLLNSVYDFTCMII